MPLRGKHPGHKPYRIVYIDRQGRRRHKSYHWRGPWEADVRRLRSPNSIMGTLVESFIKGQL